jgi:hypothetical protein
MIWRTRREMPGVDPKHKRWQLLAWLPTKNASSVHIVLSVQIAIDGVRAHSHRTRMQRMTAGRDFAVREVPPAHRLTEPFPTALMI